MTSNSSATLDAAPPLSASRAGLWWGFLGVAAFSLTLPFTRMVVDGGDMSPLFVSCGRAVVAAVLATVALAVTRQRLPRGAQWARLAIVAGGVVVGFPMLTSFALTTASASHSAVVIALLPAVTAVLAVLRGHERPRPSFWVLAALGALAAVTFASIQGGGRGGLHGSDLLLLAAVLACGIGYAEGGLLARELGAWQTISWALVLAGVPMAFVTGASMMQDPPTGTPVDWALFGYLGVVSMFLGFFAWYRGLAIGPMAQVSQVQLVQPVLTISWAALLLHEQLTWPTMLGGAAVIACAGIAVRSRLR
ncbi:DMT family transporter [Promicromonospora sp. NPDC023987]|uniref:DMT family transporter n=1 Tax=Promicromonospora sp. NPDC023987 TaxID=3155360 RepID=UPI0033C36B8D